MKVYQIFIDEKAGFKTVKTQDFEDEIIDAYRIEKDEDIPQGKLIKIMKTIDNMPVWSNVEFKDIGLKFYCLDMSEDELVH